MNAAELLYAHADARPDQVAVAVGRRGDEAARDPRFQQSFAALADRARAVAAGFARLGLGRGDRIALFVPPGPDFFALMYGLFHLQAVPVLIDPGVGLAHLRSCLAMAEPQAFVGVAKAHVARLALGWSRRGVRNVCVGPGFPGCGPRLETILRGVDSLPVPAASADQPAAILFTSGSTGVPKGAVYTHGNLAAQVAAIRQSFGIEPGEVDIATFAPFALFGPALGMTEVLPAMDFARPGRVRPEAVHAAATAWQATNMFANPTVLERLSQAPPDCLPASLRRVLCAGAPVRPATLERFLAGAPAGMEVFTPYGATEALPVAIVGSSTLLGPARGRAATGGGLCVGHPAPGAEVAIMTLTDRPIPGWSDDLRVPAGTWGEIAVRGPMVTAEYWRLPEQNRLAKILDPRGGGWHRMGDIGRFDDAGRLWFAGRKSQRVRTSAGPIFSAEVEEVLHEALAAAGAGPARTALVGIGPLDQQRPTVVHDVCIAGTAASLRRPREAAAFLRQAAAACPASAAATIFLAYPKPLPTDRRHNAKVCREELAVWAERQLRNRPQGDA